MVTIQRRKRYVIFRKAKESSAENNMTQQMLADRMNLARTTITGYETKNRQPSHEKLTAMADIFGVTVDYLIDDRESDPASANSSDTPRRNSSDIQLLEIYHGLSPKSKAELLRYAQLLELWEAYKNQ